MDKKSLQLQYIVDKADIKQSVILPLSEFDELFNQLKHLEQQLATLQNHHLATTQATSHQMTSDKGTVQPQITLLQQHYDVLNNILENLRGYENHKTELDRKLLFQRLINLVNTEQQEIRHRLGQLRKTTQTTTTLYHVAELPDHLIPMTALFNEIKTGLLAKAVLKQRPPLVIQAPSGMGKSILATALARDADIQQAFPDGVFWFSLGNDANLLVHQVSLIHQLDDTITDVFDVEEGTKRLRELCVTRACLVILDDVMDAQDVLAFNLEGEYCQLLITSSDQKLSEIIEYFINNTKGYYLNPLTEDQAIAFFCHCVGTEPNAVTVDLVDLVSASDYLPMVLKLVANLARTQSPSTWQELTDQLREAEIPSLDKYPRSLIQALQLNIDALGEPADYYLALAVFSDYLHISQSVVLMLWHYLYHLRDEEAYTFIDELAQQDLLSINDTSPKSYISLHSFQHEYICTEAELEKLHNHLLAAYRRQCGQYGWISGPNDGYFFEYLSMHLYHANRHNELKQLLLDYDWINNKLQATNVHALLNDYEWLEDKDVNVIKETLYEAAIVLHTSKSELANQLLDRLWGNQSLKSNKDIQALLNQAKEASPNWRWQPYFPEG